MSKTHEEINAEQAERVNLAFDYWVGYHRSRCAAKGREMTEALYWDAARVACWNRRDRRKAGIKFELRQVTR